MRIIENLETSDGKYDVAWRLLKDRYDNQRLSSADIEKMFRQFWIYEDNRKHQRILWRYNIAPVIVFAKIQLQDLWKLNINWDDPVPQRVADIWVNYREQLSMLNQWTISRSVRCMGAQNLQLHGFSDASERAYGVCLYVRYTLQGQHQSLLL